MHEMSIAGNILDIVHQQCPQDRLESVRSIRIRVGSAAGVVPESLEFCFDVMKRETRLKGSMLVIESVPLAGRCPACGAESPMEEIFSACPNCGSPGMTVSSGMELQVLECELVEADTTEGA